MNESVDAPATRLDVTKAVRDSFEIFKSNAVLLIVATAIATVASSLCLGIIIGPMMIGVFMICDRLVCHDAAKPAIGDLFKGFSYFIPGFVLAVFSMLGLILCGFGVLITLPIGVLAMFRIVDKGVSLGEALSFGFDAIFKKKQWQFIVLLFVAGFVSQIGAVICGLGILLTMPFYYLIFACGYRQMYPKA